MDFEKYGKIKEKLRPTQLYLKKTVPDYNPAEKYGM